MLKFLFSQNFMYFPWTLLNIFYPPACVGRNVREVACCWSLMCFEPDMEFGKKHAAAGGQTACDIFCNLSGLNVKILNVSSALRDYMAWNLIVISSKENLKRRSFELERTVWEKVEGGKNLLSVDKRLSFRKMPLCHSLFWNILKDLLNSSYILEFHWK